jgi:large subunit ribosomal protein L4
MIGLALRSALSDRAAEGKVVVVESWGWDTPSTKAAKAALAGLGIDGRALVVVGRDDAAAALSFRNLPEVQLVTPGELNAYDVLCNEYIVFTEAVLPASPTSEQSAKSTKATKSTEATKSTKATKATMAAEATNAPAATPKPAPDEGSAPSAAAGGADHPEWPGSVAADEDGSGPDTHPIKGNADSMLYHTPESPFYGRTKAEVWFDTEEHAEAAGFSKPASQQKAEAAAEESEAE